MLQTVALADKLVTFEIWDIVAQDRYPSLAPINIMYYRGAEAAICLYSITDESSFDKAKDWVKELKRKASPNIAIALVGITAADPPSKMGHKVIKYHRQAVDLNHS